MYIESQYPQRVFWRLFRSTDTVFVFGLHDGWLSNGENATHSLGGGDFKIEFKFGDALGPFLLQAGEVFSDIDRLRLLPDGTLIRIPDDGVMPVEMPPPSQVVPTREVRWAIVLCRFSDVPDVPRPQQYYTDLFTRNGVGGLCDYWSAVSMNAIDISGSQVFGWLTMPRTLAEAQALTYPGQRHIPFQWGVDVAIAAGINLSGFDKILVVQNRFVDHGEAGAGILIQHENAASCEFGFIAHEMGHGFGLPHSWSANPTIPYGDHWDLMSWQTHAFWFEAGFQGARGLATGGINARNLKALGGLPEWRIWRPKGADFSVTVPLNPLNQPPVGNDGFLSAEIPAALTGGNTYTVEFRQKAGWERGITQHTVLVHEIRPDGLSYIYPNLGSNLFQAGQRAQLPGPARIWISVANIESTGYLASVRIWDAPEGSLRKDDGNPRVYRIEAGQKRWIISPDVFRRLGLDWSSVRSVPDGGMAAIPDGPDLN